MAISEYISVELTLDSLDLIQIETLISNRVKELVEFKKSSEGGQLGWLHSNLADEQISNYRSTLKKIKAARQLVKETKAKADAEFYASLKTRKKATR